MIRRDREARAPLEYAVAIIHYGDPDRTRRCLDSLAHLDPAPRSVLVLWNGPGPVTLDHPRIDRLVAPDANLGFAAGANRAFDEIDAEGTVEAFLLLNNDTTLERNPVVRQLEALVRDDTVAAVGPRLVTPAGDIWHDGARIHWPDGRPEGLTEPEQVVEVDFVCGCAPLIRSRAFRDLGGFDERYFLTYEDADLGARLRAAGWRLLHDPGAVVVHEGGASLADGSRASRYYRLRNRILFASEHTPDAAATRRACLRLSVRTRIRALRWLLSGRSGEARALLSALRDARDGRFGPWSEA